MHRLEHYANFESPYFSNPERDEQGRRGEGEKKHFQRSAPSEFSKCLISSSPRMFFPNPSNFSFVSPLLIVATVIKCTFLFSFRAIDKDEKNFASIGTSRASIDTHTQVLIFRTLSRAAETRILSTSGSS